MTEIIDALNIIFHSPLGTAFFIIVSTTFALSCIIKFIDAFSVPFFFSSKKDDDIEDSGTYLNGKKID